MANIQLFSHEVLQDDRKFKEFLSGQDQIAQIQKYSRLPLKNDYSTLRKIWMVVKCPIELIAGLFFFLASKCLFFSSNLSKRFTLISLTLLNNLNRVMNLLTFKNKLVILNVNLPSINSSDVYLQKPLSIHKTTLIIFSKSQYCTIQKYLDKIFPMFAELLIALEKNTNFAKKQFQKQLLDVNKRFKQRLDKLKTFNFFPQNGVCYGMSIWFLYLYLKTKDSSLNSHKHMYALGKLFENGASKQAIILQELGNNNVNKLKHDIFSKKLKEKLEKAIKSNQDNSERLLTLAEKLRKIFDTIDNEFLIRRKFLKKLDLKKIDKSENVFVSKLKTPGVIKLLKEIVGKKNFVEGLSNIENGAYFLTLHNNTDKAHAISYVKIRKNLSYIFDPNIGIIMVSNKSDLQKYYSHIQSFENSKKYCEVDVFQAELIDSLQKKISQQAS